MVLPVAVSTALSSGRNAVAASLIQVTPFGITDASARWVFSRVAQPPPTSVHIGW